MLSNPLELSGCLMLIKHVVKRGKHNQTALTVKGNGWLYWV